MLVGLIGNQNSGKTTLFNSLTGYNQKIGNWPGVTIEKKEGFLKGHNDITIADTPGVYSLSPYTEEEKVTRSFCLTNKPDLIINIVDASALERSLYLTTQLLELNCDVIVVCNMTDILKNKGISLDVDKLSDFLGISVLKISAKTEEGIDDLISLIVNKKYRKNPHIKIYSKLVQTEIDHIAKDINNELEESSNTIFSAVKVFEGDPYFNALTNSSTMEEIRDIENKLNMDAEQIIADERYKFVTSMTDKAVSHSFVGQSITDKLDNIFLNRFAAIPLFILIMGAVYFLSVGLIGSFSTTFINGLLNGFTDGTLNNFIGIGPSISNWLSDIGAHDWSCDLVSNGLLGGFGAVLTFVPQLLVLFFSLAILETSGYMSRISFLLDRLLKKIGLSGKSLIPFIVGSGCSVPAISTTKIIEDEKERHLSILLTPFIPCSAKLPIISLISGFLFPTNLAWIGAFGSYVVAIMIIILSASVLKRFYKSNSSSYISELPSYKLPSLRYVGKEAFEKTISFIKRAGSTIVVCSFIIWFLSRFTWGWKYIYDLNDSQPHENLQLWQISQSMLATIGKGIAYIFIPSLGGNYSWGASVSAIQGLIAKEQVVGSMQVLTGSGSISSSPMFSFLHEQPLAGIAFLFFVLFSAPCIGAISATQKEYKNIRLTARAVLFQIGFALFFSSLIGSIGWAINGWKIIGLGI